MHDYNRFPSASRVCCITALFRRASVRETITRSQTLLAARLTAFVSLAASTLMKHRLGVTTAALSFEPDNNHTGLKLPAQVALAAAAVAQFLTLMSAAALRDSFAYTLPSS